MSGDGGKDSHIKGTEVFIEPPSVHRLERPTVGTFAVPFRVFSIIFSLSTSTVPLGVKKVSHAHKTGS